MSNAASALPMEGDPLPAATFASSAAPSAAEGRAERRRKQCRISQRRYRDKKGSMEYNLRLDINSLRASVEQLKETRGILRFKIWQDKVSFDGAVRKAVHQYYIMFQHGLHLPKTSAHASKCVDVQMRFLNAFLHPDVQYGETKGVDAIYDQWYRYAVFHDSLTIRLLTTEIFGSANAPIVKAHGTMSVRLSQATLENVFPNVLSNDEQVKALLGKDVVYTTCTTFVFNEKVQCVSLDFQVDFLAGLTTLLGSTQTTCSVLEHALIRENSTIGPIKLDDEQKKLLLMPSESSAKLLLTSTVGDVSRFDLQYIMS